jgi:hypothetical protein
MRFIPLSLDASAWAVQDDRMVTLAHLLPDRIANWHRLPAAWPYKRMFGQVSSCRANRYLLAQIAHICGGNSFLVGSFGLPGAGWGGGRTDTRAAFDLRLCFLKFAAEEL